MGQKSAGGRSKKGHQHIQHQTKYKKQFERTWRNKENAWNRHLKKHPKDLVAKSAIKRLRGKI